MAFNSLTFPELQEDFADYLQTLIPSADISAGSTFKLLSDPVLYLLAQFYVYADSVLEQAFISTATGSYLDLIVEEIGITRHEAEKASGTIRFSRTSAASTDYTIDEGTEISTVEDSNGDTINFITTETVTLETGNTYVDADIEAVEAGADGNVAADTITQLVSLPTGVESCNNSSVCTGGTDEETDTELKERYLAFVPVGRRGGSHSDYENWAMEISGVTSADTLEDEDARGPGTVDVIITEDDSSPSSELITEVQEYIDTLRPCGADVVVSSPSMNEITITLSIDTYEDGYTESDVREAVEENLIEYLKTIDLGATIYLNGLKNIVHDTAGVIDFSFTAPAGNTTQTVNQKGYADSSSITVS